MDYSTLKKLALSMGEEFKAIDNVTLEAINVQRLITREREYCSTLEASIKSVAGEITSLENETSCTKNKLEDIVNRESLLKSSLESLMSSHVMVDLLKEDLLKQLRLEMIKTSEQNIKFESTLKKYEEMWENYKVIYQKFPLVSDLHKMQTKLKLESIQLSMLDKEVKDYQNKISDFTCIQDKKEKLLLIKVAEKYLIREKLQRERDDLEKSIKSKRDGIDIEKLQGSQLLSYEANTSVMESDLENDNPGTDNLSILMDNFLTELAKENLSIVAEKGKSADLLYEDFHNYEATVNKGTSIPDLKLPPLPVFDSPPRKIRSVGNLLSPPKEWTRDCCYETVVHSLPSVDVDSNDLSICDARTANDELGTKDPTNSKEIDMDYHESEPSNSYTVPEVSEKKCEIEELQSEMVMEIDDSEVNENARNTDLNLEETEENQAEKEGVNTNVLNQTENVVGTHENNKPDFLSDSPEFTYVPRTNKTTKMEEATSETTSPYFVASSYLNFMDTPKRIDKTATKETLTKQKDNTSNDIGKGSIPIIDLGDGDDVQEDITKQSEESNKHKTESNIKMENPRMHHLEVKPASLSSNESEMEVSHNETPLNNNSSHDKNAFNKEQFTTLDDSTSGKKAESDPEYTEQRINKNIEVSSPQFSQMNDDLNISYGSPMNYSQVSYADSIDYQDTYQSLSPEACSIDESPQFMPGNHGHANIFGSCAQKSGFSYGFTSTPHQSSASSLFGSSNSENNESKERKQNEVFNFSFDTKSKTPTMFKLF